MAGQLSYYDILDVLPGASADDVQRGFDVKASVIAPHLISGAPSKVVAAAARARAALEAAQRTLSDPDSRERYDARLGMRETGGGLVQQPQLPSEGMWAWDPSWNARYGGDAGAIVEGLGAVADWLAPHPANKRHATVPDVRGLFVSPCRRLVAACGLRAEMDQLTKDPMAVEGLVVDQAPSPGTRVRSSSTVTVQVWHPSRRQDART